MTSRARRYEQGRDLRYTYDYNPLLYSTASLLGKTHEESFPPDQAARLTEIKRQVLETGRTSFDELDLTIPGDEPRHYRSSIEAVRDRYGRITGVLGASTDITEQQRTQQQLSDALEFRERMMGILGHDLRNPLASISMADGLMLNREDLPPEARTQAMRIQRASGRIAEMIDTLLDFVRVRAIGKIPVSPGPCDLGQIAEDAVDELRVVYPETQVEIEVKGDPRGQWDAMRMAQAISNLVGNAITYGAPSTPVRVSVDGEAPDVVLKINNQGPPIPAGLMPVLFEPFRRGVAQDKSPRGLGLGLYIAQQIVHAHDGTISVHSSAEQGTTFTVQLPRSPAPATLGQESGTTLH